MGAKAGNKLYHKPPHLLLPPVLGQTPEDEGEPSPKASTTLGPNSGEHVSLFAANPPYPMSVTRFQL